jgi:hypothetical protein
MLLLSLSLCAMVCTFVVARFFAVKTRFVEKNIDAAITRKLSASPFNVEINRLREQNGVMRNLLIDMLENEGTVVLDATTTPAEQERAMKARIQRRREIFGEAVFALQQGGNGRKMANNSRING